MDRVAAPTDDRYAALRRRYLSLGLGELVAAAVFTLVAATTVAPKMGRDGQVALWCALVPLLVVLTQAGVYWLLARTWAGHDVMPAAVASPYRIFRFADLALLIAGFGGLLWWFPDGHGSAVLVVVVWGFGVVEYVNYFVVRLAYPPSQWPRAVRRWQTPRLVRDLREAA